MYIIAIIIIKKCQLVCVCHWYLSTGWTMDNIVNHIAD
jgi:hypothetical protein